MIIIIFLLLITNHRDDFNKCNYFLLLYDLRSLTILSVTSRISAIRIAGSGDWKKIKRFKLTFVFRNIRINWFETLKTIFDAIACNYIIQRDWSSKNEIRDFLTPAKEILSFKLLLIFLNAINKIIVVYLCVPIWGNFGR